jgi:hypothetical protein
LGGPRDHRRFYSVKQNLKAFAFLDKQQEKKVDLPGVERISSRLVVSAGTFPAVAQSTNPCWRELSWGKKSLEGGNLWPHPIA